MIIFYNQFGNSEIHRIFQKVYKLNINWTYLKRNTSPVV